MMAKVAIKSTSIECQYQTVTTKKSTEETVISKPLCVDELLKTIKPQKSFLYPDRVTRRLKKPEKPSPYVPMDIGQKKQKKFFRFSYEYPNFDLRRFRFSKTDDFNDRGYYFVKNEKNDRQKYKSVSNAEEMFQSEHFYEDLNIDDDKRKRSKSTSHANNKSIFQDIINSFRNTFNRKSTVSKKEDKMEADEEIIEGGNIYENTDSADYDSVVIRQKDLHENCNHPAIEEYLVPIVKHYSDVDNRKEDSFFSFLFNIFDNFGVSRRKTTDKTQSEDVEKQSRLETSDVQKWNDDRKCRRHNMADRPLPVPVDNEPYFMEVDRAQAEELLMGQPDGSFILRPSSQPTHVYTLSVACGGAVHNVGVRRRPDGRLALGYPRRGERAFPSIPELIRAHRRRRLQLVGPGGLLGTTALTDPPVYYVTPSNVPVYSDATLEKT